MSACRRPWIFGGWRLELGVPMLVALSRAEVEALVAVETARLAGAAGTEPDRWAARRVGSGTLADALRAGLAASVAWEEHIRADLAPVVAAGYRPPLIEGFGRFVSSAGVENALRQQIERELADGTAGPFSGCPPLAARLERLSSGASSDLPDDRSEPPWRAELVRAEAAVVARLFPGTGNRLKPIAWRGVGEVVYLPQWRRISDANAKALADVTMASLPNLLADPDSLAHRLAAGPADRRSPRMAIAAVGAALAVTLAEDGWSIEICPGDHVAAVRDGQKLLPFEAATRLAAGELSASDWLSALSLHSISTGRCLAPR